MAFPLILAALLAASVPQYAVEKKMPIPGDGGWDCITIDSDSHHLFISRGTHVQVLDVETGKMAGDILNTQGVHAIAVVPKLNKGYITNGRDDSVGVFDLKTLHELKRVKVGNRPDVIYFDSTTNRIFSFNPGSVDVTAIDVNTDAVVGSLKLGGKPEFAVSDGKGTIFVNLEDKSSIERFDALKLTSMGTWPLAPGEEPTGLGIDLKRHQLFSACANQMFAVTDFKTGKVVATPKIGNGPDGGIYDSGRNLAFSPNGQDGTLTVIGRKGDGFEVLQTVPTQRGARTMALDTKTHKIYLIAAQYEVPAAGAPANQRPRMIPGSASILVVSPVRG